MKYECYECERMFDTPDIIRESHGAEDGSYEEIGICPYCKGYFHKVYRCKICGNHLTEDEIINDVCDECIYEHDTDIELCYKVGNIEDTKETLAINGFIASLFTAERLEELAMSELRRIKSTFGIAINCTEFIGSDKAYFANQLVKEK